MTIINGANNHNVDDILSSIRNSMGEDNAFARTATARPYTRREGGMHDDNAEFELPAIFKPGNHGPSEKPNNLFGRLSDALKPAAGQEPERSRTVIRFEPAAARMIEPPPAMTAAQAPQPESASEPVVSAAIENSNIKREMPSFFDTRLNKLGEMTRLANAPKPVEPPQPAPQALVPQQPPPLRPAQHAEAGGDMEDAAAQLLRPILKQWLMENMPKIVEKALRSEAHEDFTSQGMPQGGRKPGQ